MGEVFLLMASSAVPVLLIAVVILLVRRRMRRGEIAQATVSRVDLDDSDPDGPAAVTLTYAFSWQGQTVEICQPPCRGILPPREGERGKMRWDPISHRLRELPSGRSLFMPLLIYALVLSGLTMAASFAVAALPSVTILLLFPVSALEVIGFLGSPALAGPAAARDLSKAGGVRHPPAGAGRIPGLCPSAG